MPVYTSNPRNVIVGGDGGVVVNPGGGTVPAGASRYIPEGGTTGQLLGKASDDNYDVSWQTISSAGTVTSVSATDSTGIDFTIINPTSTPNISLSLTSAAVGLSNVDNTSDANKPVSTATQTALNAKQNTISLTTTGSSGAATLVGATLNIPNYTDTNTNFANTNLTFDANRSHELGSNSLSLVNGASFSEWFLNAVSQVITRYAPSSFRNAQMAVTGDDSDSGTQAILRATGNSLEAYFLAKGTGSAEIKGLLYLPNYNTAVSGTVARVLALDASGNVITSAASSGDVVGPSGATNNNLAAFDLTTGKLIKDSGSSIATITTAIDAKVADAINDGVTTVAPSQNAVFDALALKVGVSSLNSLTVPVFNQIYAALGGTSLYTTLGLSRANLSTGINLADGGLRLIAIYIPVASTITGVRWWQSAAGDYTADNYNGIALYSYSGGTATLVASSTDDGNIWKATVNTLGQKAFSSPYVASAGVYFVGALYNSSAQTTAPQIGSYASLQNAGLSTSGLANSAKISSLVTAQNTLPATVSMASAASSLNMFYFELY